MTGASQAPDVSTGEPVILPYIDNLSVAWLDPARVRAARDGAARRLREAGFIVHEEMGPDTQA